MKKYKPHIGLYWGKEGFYVVESKDKQIHRSVYLPFATPLESDTTENLPEDLKYTALLQKLFQDNPFTGTEISLSLNDRDIIFRSFSIPWMLPHEAKNVVEFEVTKYIPVPLERLVYAFHTEPFSDNNQKNLKILFFAVRRDTLDKYRRIIENAGLRLSHIEPNPVSLTRLLLKMGHLAHNQAFAVIVMDQQDGKIIVSDRDVVQFVREFPISESEDDITFSSSKIYNDIRVSLNFYTRQNPGGKIDKILVLSENDLPKFTSGLSNEFGKNANNVKTSQILKMDGSQAVGFLIAYSISQREDKYTSRDFELSEDAKARQKAGEEALLKMRQYKRVAGVFVVSLLVVMLASFLSKLQVSAYQKKLNKLKQQQGAYDIKETSQLQTQTNELSQKLGRYRDIRLGTEVTFYLHYIPQLLPKGIWLKNITVQHYEKETFQDNQKRVQSRPLVTLNGYAYNPDSNEQFRLVTNFVSTLKEDKTLSNMFSDIARASMNQETLGAYRVTAFQITCK